MNDGDDNSFYYFWDEPAVAETPTVIRTAYGSFYVPSAEKDPLTVCNLLWVAFRVEKANDMDKAVDFRFTAVDSAKIVLPANREAFEGYLADSYTDSIELAGLSKSVLDHVLFFEFSHKKTSDISTFVYELVWDPETKGKLGETGEQPTLYIRAKSDASAMRSSDQGISDLGKVIFGFDMTDFVTYYKANISSSGPVTFNLKYKIGTDNDGKDVYRNFQSNPIKWETK
jgi:hypothetical protein